MALLRGKTSKNKGDFYLLNCLHSFRTKNKREPHKKVHEDTKILEFSRYQKSHKAPLIIYGDLENIQKKRLVAVKVILKVHLQQK